MEVAVTHPRDTAETILEVVDRGLREQQHGPVSLLEVDHAMPARVLDLLVENFEANRDVIVRTRGRMGFADWAALAVIARPDLRDQPLKPAKLWRKGSPDIFDEIRYRDRMVHHPFDSFQWWNRSWTRRSTIRASSPSR
jgi:polyphosphate kinase